LSILFVSMMHGQTNIKLKESMHACHIVVLNSKLKKATSTITHSNNSLIYMYQDPKITRVNIYCTTNIHVSKKLLLLS
jgi:hypothetical protein